MRGRFKGWLLAQADHQRRNLTLVLTGTSVVFMGLALVYYAEHRLTVSLQQELTALIGLLFIAGGGILAALGYLALSLLRIFKFIHDDND